MKPACPICKKELPSEQRSEAFPFCSWRCKKVDLYNWLNEEYRFTEPLLQQSSDELDSEGEFNGGGASV
jgi:endogenous inhibitor of DNA gyrase (YacG/DUF329 family)